MKNSVIIIIAAGISMETIPFLKKSFGNNRELRSELSFFPYPSGMPTEYKLFYSDPLRQRRFPFAHSCTLYFRRQRRNFHASYHKSLKLSMALGNICHKAATFSPPAQERILRLPFFIPPQRAFSRTDSESVRTRPASVRAAPSSQGKIFGNGRKEKSPPRFPAAGCNGP